MVTSALRPGRMDALLTSKQYPAAIQFAMKSISRNSTNEDSMGRKLRTEIDRLRNAKQYPDAVQLINAVNQMKPPLADQFLNPIKNIEADVHQKMATGQNSPISELASEEASHFSKLCLPATNSTLADRDIATNRTAIIVGTRFSTA